MAKRSRPNDNDLIKTLKTRITDLEKIVNNIGVAMSGARKNRFPTKRQNNLFTVMSKALCIETVDTRKENRVRFYHPLIHHPKTPILALPWARPISAFGGFDDCGLNWVPPAGSTLCIIFEMGDREAAHYIGTSWQIDRGPGGKDLYKESREWDSVYAGHRKGYLIGKNDESQCFPPWNTESYNGNDIYQVDQFLDSREEQIRTTYPNIYGFKTPEKHMLKMVDGNAKCNRRWKRIELMSGCGNWMIFKDDHLHYGGQWSHPDCGPNPGGAAVDICSTHKDKLPYFTDFHGNPIEGTTCEGGSKKGCGKSSNILTGHPSTPDFPPSYEGKSTTPYANTNQGTNPFFKHANECRPYKGPGTPQNNRCDLPQSGIQLLSISGHTIVFDDSVKEPKGKPEWERSMESFDFGCDDTYEGVFYMKSATGHSFVMSDVESKSKLRGMQNYVEMKSAGGNRIHMNDHTIPDQCNQETNEDCGCECPTSPPYMGGKFRGIYMESTSEHLLQFCDSQNYQIGPCRQEGGEPANKAKEAHIILQSGYGHKLEMKDYEGTQRDTKGQFIELNNPQCSKSGPKEDKHCNVTKGPHFLRMQAKPDPQPGIVFLRCGGHHMRTTTDMDIVLVGSKENPSDKFTWVSKDYTDATEKVHFRYAGDRHLFFAENKIVLMAGRDCPPPPNSKCPGPCIYSVIVSRCPKICPVTGILHWTEKAMSERVFASAHHPCQTPPDCGGGCEEYFEQMAQADLSTCNESQNFDFDLGKPVQIHKPPLGTNVAPVSYGGSSS